MDPPTQTPHKGHPENQQLWLVYTGLPLPLHKPLKIMHFDFKISMAPEQLWLVYTGLPLPYINL